MADVLADASSIIVAARLNGIEMVSAVLGLIGLTETVWRESVEAGKALGYSDASAIEQGRRNGLIEVINLTAEERRRVDEIVANSSAYHRGESETIICAETRRLPVLIEERRGRSLARSRGVIYTVLQAVPLQGYIERKLPRNEADQWLERIAVAMNTDLAVFQALRGAVQALDEERQIMN